VKTRGGGVGIEELGSAGPGGAGGAGGGGVGVDEAGRAVLDGAEAGVAERFAN
jgi:hypothetical protein